MRLLLPILLLLLGLGGGVGVGLFLGGGAEMEEADAEDAPTGEGTEDAATPAPRRNRRQLGYAGQCGDGIRQAPQSVHRARGTARIGAVSGHNGSDGRGHHWRERRHFPA